MQFISPDGDCGQIPPDAVQAIELRAPRQYGEAIAAEVRELDGLNREVVGG